MYPYCGFTDMTSISNKISRKQFHAHSGSLEELLAIIEKHLTAAAIMTPWKQVAVINAEANSPEAKKRAGELMDRNFYSGVPMVCADRVRGVFLRFEPGRNVNFEGTKAEQFVKPDISLLTLIGRMRDTQRIVVGIGSAESPEGWVTYADFSKRPFRVLLFALMAEIEYLLARALDMAYPDDSWIELLPKDENREELQKRQKEAQHWDVLMPLTTFANIGDLIRAMPHSPEALAMLGETAAIDTHLKSIPELRNNVDHVVRPVVRGPKQISSVANQIDLMLEWAKRWTANLADRDGSRGSSCA